MNKPEMLLKNIAILGEGPVWDSKNSILYFVDIDGCKLCSFDYKNYKNNKDNINKIGGYCEIPAPGRLGAISMCESPDKFICAIENNLYLFENEKFTPFIENIYETAGDIRFNDGKCDKNGRFYIGSMDGGGKSRGNLYKITGNKEVLTCENNINCSNGIAFSDDGKYMYYIDTPTGFLWRYDYDSVTGNIENRTALIDYREEKGVFDGMTIDKNGCLWVALWGGFAVNCYDSVSGKKLDVIELPVPNVTSCEFGGEDMNILFITTYGGGNENLKKEYPLSGSLFALEFDETKGLECNKFAI